MHTACIVGTLALLLLCNMARAQVSGQVALLSDYRFRGESLSDEEPALQAVVNYDHASGLFIGAAASNVRFETGASGVGAQFYGGYARAFGDTASWDIGLVTYVYPPAGRGFDYDFTEAFIGVSIDKVSARAYYSDDYFGTGAHAVYVECNASHPLNDRVTLIAHIGYLPSRRGARYWGTKDQPEQLDFKAGVGIAVAGFNLELSVVGTNAPQNRCAAGTDHCGTTGVVSISRTF